MLVLISILCVILVIVCILLVVKVFAIRRAAEQLRLEFSRRLREDTNVGIDISTSDKAMRRLAADLNNDLKLLRKEHIRYIRGDQELKNAITNISHDLRTPLTAICGYMDLLQQEDVSETVREYLNIIYNRVVALKELTEELFQYSIIVSADHSTEKEEISLNAMLEECFAAYYGALKEAQIEPQIFIPETVVERKLNKKAFMRIVSNIISNAMKYSDGDFNVLLKENGTIQFSNRASKLDEVQVGHLFDRFYTVENVQNATGLGLSIAKTLTEEMKGHIDAVYQDGVLKITLAF